MPKMKKIFTYEDLIQLAQKHYNEGGDGIVECWTRETFDEYVAEFGPMTRSSALALVRLKTDF